MYTLQNRLTSLTFDPQGALLALINRQTGRNYVAQPSIPWKLIYSDDDCLEREITAEEQEPPQVEIGPQHLTFTYPHLHTGQGTLDIALRLTVQVHGEEETLWRAAIDNRAPVMVREVWFPWLRGIVSVGRDPAHDCLAWPAGCGQRIPNPLARLGGDHSFRGYSLEYNRLRGLYPGPLSMQWLDLYTADAGLYLASYDPSLATTCLHISKQFDPTETLALAIVKYPFAGQGASWDSPPAGVAAHTGDWHWGARRYRAWANAWMQTPKPPGWVQRMPGWVCTIMKHQYGEINWDYPGIGQLLTEAQSVGLDTLFLFGWYQGGHDNGYPTSYDPDPLMGGAEGLRAALADVRRRGGRAILYTQGRLLDPAADYYAHTGHRIAARSVWGQPYQESYTFWGPGTLLDAASHKQFAIACPGCPEWGEQLLAQGHAVHRLGADGVLFDQIGGQPPYPCFAEGHGHATPAEAFGAPQLRNLRALREEFKAVDAEFSLVVECLTDALAGYVDVTHGAWPGFQHGPESMPELFRYTFPEHILTDRMTEREDLAEAGFAFVNGLRFNVEIDAARGTMARAPRLAHLLRGLTGLYRRYAPWLLEGTFVDGEGAEGAANGLVHRTFRAAEGLAVVQWNPTDEPQAADLRTGGRVREALQVAPDEDVQPAEGPLPPGALRVTLVDGPCASQASQEGGR